MALDDFDQSEKRFASITPSDALSLGEFTIKEDGHLGILTWSWRRQRDP